MDRRLLLKRAAALAGIALQPLKVISSPLINPNPRILVIFELSGGNDGLNTIVPYKNDEYYKLRPTIALPKSKLLEIDDEWGMNPGFAGMKQIWDRGDLAIIHGCGYERPSYSHFTSMAYWHTATPNSGDPYGWCGRTADALAPHAPESYIININSSQSLAVQSKYHTPIVFDDPSEFRKIIRNEQLSAIPDIKKNNTQKNNTLDFLHDIEKSAKASSLKVRKAWENYDSVVDYGALSSQLDKVAACIAAGFPTQIYYVSFRNNAFDTHVHQVNLHQRLLTYAADAVRGFLADMERLGMADNVSLMMFSEFGRRAGENANLGTDHGSANNMFLAGKAVQGGHYGKAPNLLDLDDTDNLKFTTDFRRVYATAIEGWLESKKAEEILKGKFQSLPIFT
jgi:uncharacterized protein (DUF1501 family)